ncbi:hypothetical protein AC482_03285 [miscellaneous Crenarchaeota group-15 archaeon DG-45]|uniref:Uncharacterized protein n=1 Tax=miscellaneous Crenarchaeota group-15 archaeon DG-45 TaxID=1685127 RepID=A0A0M0BQF6_9ARCH|nr:MAG: hypothetical protein AC482_03285 [miscellaneous Crenarchaeota group-15 archaeon DG-45]
MSLERLESRNILEFLNALQPPVHIILLNAEPSERVDLPEMLAEATRSATSEHEANRLHGVSLLTAGSETGWEINDIESDRLSEPSELLRMEEKIKADRKPRMVMCIYPLTQTMELGEVLFIDIISLHDYIIFSSYEEGGRLLLKAVEKALTSALGDSGSEMLYRFARQMGVERERIPCELRQFRRILRDLLGIGAEFLEKAIFRRLYLELGSSIQAACPDE